MKWINTTPHSITEFTTGQIFPSDPNVQLRITETFSLENLYDQVPMFKRQFGTLNVSPPMDLGETSMSSEGRFRFSR